MTLNSLPKAAARHFKFTISVTLTILPELSTLAMLPETNISFITY